jgi:GNAT superfamily N-acetyltransferase
MPWSLRPAVPGDAERIAAVLNEGFDGYRSFAPQGWEPPDPQTELKRLRGFLGGDEVWCLIAEGDGVIAGHVAFMPARVHPQPSYDDSMAHFWQLFVRERWWGTGLANTLHAEAVREAGVRGFTSMRLFTPAAHARARRFYEREGWTPAGEPFDDLDFGMPLVEYRRAISISV